jgi:uncharacterized pyridoxal phosphate-containing UPF0001 family protein
VNTGLERQKAGIAASGVPAFLAQVTAIGGLKVEGLMCIPPVEEPPGVHFGLLARLARENSLTVISMGMSGDFEEAIAHGATHVRIGSALFGARP